MKKKPKKEYELVAVDMGDGGQFGRIMKTVKRLKRPPDHCCDWTGWETCPGCLYEKEQRNNTK